jgi:hypothetical protein
MTWAEAIATLPEDLRPVLLQLRDDYIAARDVHVPSLISGAAPASAFCSNSFGKAGGGYRQIRTLPADAV